jgi:hypothetical protein
MMLKRALHSVHAEEQDIARSSGQEASMDEIGRVIVDQGLVVTT